jgi:hypothetical protein
MSHTSQVFIIVLLFAVGPVFAEFVSGSDGSYGPLVVSTSDPQTVTLPLPADGIIRATTVSIAQNHALRFERNPLNTPVIILAQGDVVILGTINLSGGNATPFTGGLGGPGGFNGGAPGSNGVPPGSGFGPGAGAPGDNSVNSPTGAGGGAYSTRPFGNPNGQHGNIYGSPLLVPPIGGSGGGGIDNSTGSPSGGGGGGGAILIASNTRISMGTTGLIYSFGGSGFTGYTNGGSGGAVRLVAPVVEGSGAIIDVSGAGFGRDGGNGRIRIDTLDRSKLGITLTGVPSATIGSFMVAIPEVASKLHIDQVAGQAIPEGSNLVSLTLPAGTDPHQNVVVRATDFEGMVDIDVIVTPENGIRAVYPATIDAATTGPAEVTVPVQIPSNTGVVLNAWTR